MKDLSHQEIFYKALRKYGWENFTFEVIESFDDFDQELLNDLEQKYIEQYNSLVPNGYNMIPGGTNGAGLAKGKPVEQFDLNGKYIQEFPSASEASRQTGINYMDICACCRNKPSYRRAGYFQWRYKDSDKVILPIEKIVRVQPVYQFSLDNQLIRKYDSLKEASELSGITKSLICKCCNDKAITAGGYKWSYTEQPSKRESKTQKKRIGQYTLDNELIEIFESISAASKKTKISLSTIAEAAKGKRRKTAGNFIWKFL